jgi:hypothetical protein
VQLARKVEDSQAALLIDQALASDPPPARLKAYLDGLNTAWKQSALRAASQRAVDAIVQAGTDAPWESIASYSTAFRSSEEARIKHREERG